MRHNPHFSCTQPWLCKQCRKYSEYFSIIINIVIYNILIYNTKYEEIDALPHPAHPHSPVVGCWAHAYGSHCIDKAQPTQPLCLRSFPGFSVLHQ